MQMQQQYMQEHRHTFAANRLQSADIDRHNSHHNQQQQQQQHGYYPTAAAPAQQLPYAAPMQSASCGVMCAQPSGVVADVTMLDATTGVPQRSISIAGAAAPGVLPAAKVAYPVSAAAHRPGAAGDNNGAYPEESVMSFSEVQGLQRQQQQHQQPSHVAAAAASVGGAAGGGDAAGGDDADGAHVPPNNVDDVYGEYNTGVADEGSDNEAEVRHCTLHIA